MAASGDSLAGDAEYHPARDREHVHVCILVSSCSYTATVLNHGASPDVLILPQSPPRPFVQVPHSGDKTPP